MSEDEHRKGSVFEVFRVFLVLGLTSFGGPVAHLGYFREAFVARRKWLSDAAYAELVALCQFLPGPASSQVGLAIGLHRAGIAGAFAAWTAFTAPSAIALVIFTLGIGWTGWMETGAVAGLKLAALAIVAHAVLGMASSLAPDTPRRLFAVAAAIAMLLAPWAMAQVAVIAIAALAGTLLLKADPVPTDTIVTRLPRRFALGCLAAFFALIAGLPILTGLTGNTALGLFDSFYRAGSLVFGGGHVVLPLLHGEIVVPGLASENAFLAGYGATQAVPGPLFTFAAYLGYVVTTEPNGILGALIALVGIYVPSFLLVFGVLPFWPQLSSAPRARAALSGANAAVLGLLGAALYQPVFTSAVATPLHLALALAAYAALVLIKLPPWLVVLACGLGGYLLGL